MASAAPRSDLPTIEDETRPFWDALREGRLLIARCDSCGEVHYYPRPMCPFCWSEDVSLVEASGTGTLYTWSTVHVNDLPPLNTMVPYVAAQVDLSEGVRMTTRLVDVAPGDLAIGMALEVAFEAISDDVTIPVFRPVGS
ncbi:MAG TPA: Zn-ribbon domain-containing OB-fold protein [Novosphingobium sp.]|nr:Zn-ribbon domain-containing OB-fold protein [Novosphingobium sp.]